MRKKRLAGWLAAGIAALLLSGCKETGAASADITENEEIIVDSVDSEEKPETPEETAALEEKAETEQEESQQDWIVGTWKTRTDTSDSALEMWLQTYTTCFSPDGQVVHYGHRNVDRGSWRRIDENTVIADFDQCIYKGIGGEEYPIDEYSVTYRFNEDKTSLSRTSLSRSTRYEERYFTARMEKEGEWVSYHVSDFDNYGEILLRESDECEIEEEYNTMAVFPDEGEFCMKLEKRLIGIAKDLAEGREVELEEIDLPYELEQVAFYDLTGDGKEEIFAYVSMLPHHPDNDSGATYILTPTNSGIYTILAKNTRNIYSELLAPDGTVLLSDSIYQGSSSWKGGVRIHLGYRAGQVTVEKKESYNFHWDFPLVNKVNDFQNGRYSVYVARNPEQGEAERYGAYIDIEDSLKIDEEYFQPKQVSFTDYNYFDSEYPALYSEWSPFPEGWWQDGGLYAEDVEDGNADNYADWVEKAADDRPDELLRKAVEQSGLIMEKKAYPWTAETKKNVTEILRCPAADYYYESDDYAAEYVRGDIVFYEKVFYAGAEQEEKRVIWQGTAEDAPPAVCYLDVLEEYERLWENGTLEEEETEKEKNDGNWHTSGKYAGLYFENVLCEKENEYKENRQLCYSLVDLSGEGICELLIGMRNTENPDSDGWLFTAFTCQSGEITTIIYWYGGEYLGGQDWALCRGNVLEISRAVYGYGDYGYYTLAPYAAWAKMTETFGYIGHMVDQEMQYDYYDSNEEPISEAEYEELLRHYARVKIEWKELDGFF
ncbi:MAG: hypothetical protein NC392_00580 [Roseburia sp.]|nr:hypothetical protein [Roseburia sp.]